jgi:hypothetical protein
MNGTTPPLCIDCEFCHRLSGEPAIHICKHPDSIVATPPDYVAGLFGAGELQTTCRTMRTTGLCGPHASLMQTKRKRGERG